MSRVKSNHFRSSGHVLGPVITIGSLSMILASGLEMLGFLNRANTEIARLVARNGAENFPNHLPAWCIWLAAAGFAFGLATAVLGTPGHGRRAVLWISTLVLVAAWAPVLSLAAHAPEIAAPWITTLWSGICGLIYAANHHMACDDKPSSSNEPH